MRGSREFYGKLKVSPVTRQVRNVIYLCIMDTIVWPRNIFLSRGVDKSDSYRGS